MKSKVRRAWVHLNLHNRKFSYKYSGERVSLADAVLMRNCEFHVSARLRKQFEEHPNRRTVHAHVVGEIVSFDVPPDFAGTRLSCNPFTYSTFVRVRDGVKVIRADEVALFPDGHMEARGLVLDTTADTRSVLASANAA